MTTHDDSNPMPPTGGPAPHGSQAPHSQSDAGRDTPTCWQCGYLLTGLGVDDRCPECGTPVWSSPGIDHALQKVQKHASNAQLWGILSLALFFACLGPLSAIMTIPVFVSASRAKRAMTEGRVRKSQVSGLTAGIVCAWITLSLTILSVGFYGLILFGLLFA